MSFSICGLRTLFPRLVNFGFCSPERDRQSQGRARFSVYSIRCLRILALTVYLPFLPIAAHAAGDAAAGEQKAYTCLGCHGVKHYVNTYPTYHVPKIAGQHETYLISALQSYRSKQRGHATMQANAGLLTDQDIADIAAYFSSIGGKKPESVASGAGIEEAATCAACHASDGNSVQPSNPILAGQYKSYIRQALLAYKSGERQNPIMSGFAAGLSEADIAKLAKYFSSQKSGIKTAE